MRQSVCDGSSAAIDADNDGVPNCDEIAGCTDPTACNYDESATDDDGSCDAYFDFMGAEFGINYPDPLLGETFATSRVKVAPTLCGRHSRHHSRFDDGSFHP